MIDPSEVAAVVLAAGGSSRFGADRPKQLTPIAGVPMVRHVTATVLAAGFGEVVVVVGHEATAVAAVVADLDVRIAGNQNWAEGQSTSVRVGLRAVSAAARGVCFVPGDLPWLRSETLHRLVAALSPPRVTIVVPVVAGRPRAPVLFAREHRSELETLVGDAGGRQILAHHRDVTAEVAVDDPRELEDVDHSGDLPPE